MGLQKKKKKTQKKTKITKEEMQHVLNSKRGASRGSPQMMEKRKNKFEIGKRLKQRWKLKEDVKP
jgi:hypothetical protein